MNLNILKPGQAVEDAFEKPNLGLAIGLVFAAFVVWLAHAFVISGMPNMQTVLFGLVGTFFRFFVLVVIVFILGIILNKQASKDHFYGVISAISLLQILFIAVYVLSLGLFFMSPAPLTELMMSGSAQFDSAYTAGAEAYKTVFENMGAIDFTVFSAFLAAGFALMLFGLYIVYKTFKRLAGTGFFGSLLAALVALIAAGLIV